MGNGLTVRGLLGCAVLAAALAIPGIKPPPAQGPSHTGSAAAKQPPADPDATDVLVRNAACLVCHLTFVKEPLARSHQLKGITCANCHGASIAHANDEHVGATRPDITFPSEKVDKACKVCHEDHDVPATKVIAVPGAEASTAAGCHMH